jgi:cytochrome d ubiquinol oxidase subunit I
MPTIAGQAGWFLAETGRQPWIVYPSVQNGVPVPGLRVSDALSEAVTAEQVIASIIMFGLIYLMLFALWIFVLDRKIRHGPSEPKAGEEPPPMHGPPGGIAAAIAGGKSLTGAR